MPNQPIFIWTFTVLRTYNFVQELLFIFSNLLVFKLDFLEQMLKKLWWWKTKKGKVLWLMQSHCRVWMFGLRWCTTGLSIQSIHSSWVKLQKSLSPKHDSALLEQVCCKELRKKSLNQETGLGNMGPLEALNDVKLILNDSECHSCSFRTNLISFKTFRCPLFPEPVSWLGLFFCHFIGEGKVFLLLWPKWGWGLKLLMFFMCGLDPFLEWEQTGLY